MSMLKLNFDKLMSSEPTIYDGSICIYGFENK